MNTEPSERKEAPERIWIEWPKQQSDDAWYWQYDEDGYIEYVRADLATPESFEEAQLRQLYEDPHPGYDCGKTCVIHSGRFAANSVKDSEGNHQHE